MIATAGQRRRRLTAAALCALVLFAAAAESVAAQDPPPPPPDTISADTLALEADTIIPPAVLFPLMPVAEVSAAAGTEWVWDREMLLRETAVSLIDLLERIPGITTFRAGTFVQPEVASAFGATAGRTEVVVDGFVIDPLAAPVLDLSQIQLVHLREVRVQRRLGLLRIILHTEYPEEGRPYTRIEAGIGVPEANLFRGLFLAPHVIAGPLGLAIDRLNADGTGRNEPATVFNAWVKWAWTNGERGVQLELLRSSLDRDPDSPWLLDRTRQDLVLRARNRFHPNLVAEAYVGRGSLDETTPPPADSLSDLHVERESVQAGLRAGLDLTRAVVNASLRYRSQKRLPTMQASLDAEADLDWIRLGGEFGLNVWDDNDPTSYLDLRAETQPLYGASAFAEITRGSLGAPLYLDTIGDGVRFTNRNGWRAGLELDLGRAYGRIAYLSVDQDQAVPFGLPFDTAGRPTPLETGTAIEAYGRVVIWPDYLTLSSWITDWREASDWPWLPLRSWRTALELHAIPLESGNLEIFGRAEAHMRGSLLAYDPAPVAGSTGFVTLPSFTTLDGYLQIRIIDVRMFIRWEDILNNDIEEVPGRVYRGPRIFYGVKWQLWN